MIATLRLATGLILFIFVFCHLLNHAFGLISIEAMDRAHAILLVPWRTLLGTIILSAALVIHMCLAFRSIIVRRTLRLPTWEWSQLLLGLAVPALILKHVLGTRYFELAHGVETSYSFVLAAHWVVDRTHIVLQTLAVLVAWVHGCIGLHFWLRTKMNYVKWRPLLFGTAVVIPTASLAGYISAGYELLRDIENEDIFPYEVFEEAGVTAENVALIEGLYLPGYTVIAVLIALPFLFHFIRRLVRRVRDKCVVKLQGGREYRVENGATILETSEAMKYPMRRYVVAVLDVQLVE